MHFCVRQEFPVVRKRRAIVPSFLNIISPSPSRAREKGRARARPRGSLMYTCIREMFPGDAIVPAAQSRLEDWVTAGRPPALCPRRAGSSTFRRTVDLPPRVRRGKESSAGDSSRNNHNCYYSTITKAYLFSYSSSIPIKFSPEKQRALFFDVPPICICIAVKKVHLHPQGELFSWCSITAMPSVTND